MPRRHDDLFDAIAFERLKALGNPGAVGWTPASPICLEARANENETGAFQPFR
jgi:hypothetical protein